jgi:RND superfamily putative drug exporter
MAFARHRAGPAIFASGSTVIAGMLCLLVATMNSTKGLGPVAAIGIAIGLAVMLTLLPALLVVCGRWIFWPVRPTYGSYDHTRDGVWARIGARIARAPRRTWVVTSVLLAVASLGVLQLNAVGLQNRDAFYTTPESVVGERVLARHFPAGAGSPVMVLANANRTTEVGIALRTVRGVASVGDPVTRGGRTLIQATLTSAPDSEAATRTVDRIRSAIAVVPGADAIAGGDTATRADTLRAAANDNVRIIPLILTVVLLILVLLLRAITAPLVLIGTVVLSFGAALGLSSLAFRHVFGFAGADSSLPLFVFVFLVALGIDYNIFLMTRVREEAREIGTRRGALVGLAATGGVITSAGLVLAGTFAVLGTLPVVTFAEIGVAVALGVLLDTLVVRPVLVTALNLDLRGRTWWPSRLASQDAALDAAPSPAEEGAPTLEPAQRRGPPRVPASAGCRRVCRGHAKGVARGIRGGRLLARHRGEVPAREPEQDWSPTHNPIHPREGRSDVRQQPGDEQLLQQRHSSLQDLLLRDARLRRRGAVRRAAPEVRRGWADDGLPEAQPRAGELHRAPRRRGRRREGGGRPRRPGRHLRALHRGADQDRRQGHLPRDGRRDRLVQGPVRQHPRCHRDAACLRGGPA